MILLGYLKAGFEKGANYRCDIDGYRPDILGAALTFVIQRKPQYLESRVLVLHPNSETA
jgi:hypothetical protein